MSGESAGTQRFDPARHDVAAFDCANELLNRWLKRYAGQSERRDAARTFVAPGPGESMLGYYTLLAGQLQHEAATAAVRRGQTRHFPIPIALLGAWRSTGATRARGSGPSYSQTPSRESSSPPRRSPVRAVVVHAIDDRARLLRVGSALSPPPRAR